MQQYRSQLEEWYFACFHEILDLDNPKSFNEKMQWLKLFDSTPIKTKLADKYLVREWVKEKIGEQYLIPLLGSYERFSDIDFDSLPDRFVIKCNHGCAFNIVVKDRRQFDVEKARGDVEMWMTTNFGVVRSLPLHYKNIKPRVLVEQYIENSTSNGDLYDYKFWCFGGKVRYIMFLSGRNIDGLKMKFFDCDWQDQGFAYNYPINTENIPRPDNLQEMIDLAEKLANGFSHVRVDFYRLDDGRVYFGEMTFTTASGCCCWSDDRINQELGELIILPSDAYNVETGERFDPRYTRMSPSVARRIVAQQRDAWGRKLENREHWLSESLSKREILVKKNEELRDALEKTRSDRDAKSQQVQELRDALEKTRSDRDAKSQQVQELRGALEKTRSDRDAKSQQVQEFRAACRSAKETAVCVRLQRDELLRDFKRIKSVVGVT